MILRLILFLLFLSPLSGVELKKENDNLLTNNWSIRLYSGYATHRPLIAIITYGDIRPEYHDTGIRGLDISHILVRNWKGYSVDWSFRLGYIRHLENGFQPNHNQYNIFFMVHYYTSFRGFPIRLFVGEGLSRAERVPYVEGRETRRLSDERDSKLMNYINVGFDLKLGDLLGLQQWNHITLGLADSHRSGIYQKVKWFNHTKGGSNFVNLFLEYSL